MSDWQASLTQRILELAAALEAAEPELFVSRARWADKALRAREMAGEDLRASLVCLRQVLGEEMPEAAGREAGGYVDQALAALAGTPAAGTPAAGSPAAEATGLDPRDPDARLALRYLEQALAGDARGAVELLVAAVDDGLDPRQAILEVLLPAQREVGGMWHLGQLGIAEEHLVTATSERAMAILVQRAERRPANGKTAIAAAVAGNAHGLAVRLVADFFELAGWRTLCLGADVPAPELAAAARYFDADLVVLSAALTTQLKTLRRSVEALRRLPDRDFKILVGGGALVEAPELWRRLGADGHAATADEAVLLGGRLVGLTAA